MEENYYKSCKALDKYGRLIGQYCLQGKYEECFAGRLPLTEAGYPLAERQAGCFYYEGVAVGQNLERAGEWYRKAALQGHPEAVKKCWEMDIALHL